MENDVFLTDCVTAYSHKMVASIKFRLTGALLTIMFNTEKQYRISLQKNSLSSILCFVYFFISVLYFTKMS